MTKQANIMRNAEADAWYLRNKDSLDDGPDDVVDVIDELSLEPKTVMEIGCADGGRLWKLRQTYGCQVAGVEPSHIAFWQARKTTQGGGKALGRVFRGTAEKLPSVMTEWADILIYGFCLYLADPEDWFRIAMEGDRVLKAGGHLIIHDFYHIGAPWRRAYAHREGMFSYHADFASIWLGHPLYSLVRRRIISDGEESVVVLKKGDPYNVEVVT